MKKELVLIIDLGGHSNHLIARRIRELSVYSEMVPYDISCSEVMAKNPQAIIITGDPADAFTGNTANGDPQILKMGIPILGIGYGMHYMVAHLGGKVESTGSGKHNSSNLQIIEDDKLFAGALGITQVFLNHTDSVLAVPPGFVVTARTDTGTIAAISSPEQQLYGIQFHPVARHTLFGMDILNNFLFNICGLKGDWNLDAFIKDTIEEVKLLVGDKKVLCALSGGVDSSVAATLVYKAVGDQLVSVFVDNGLLRKGEPEQVIKTFKDEMGMNLVFVEAKDRFLARLKGISDPERKRKIIGEEFIRVFEQEKAKLGEIDYLVQGTIYPDIIESGTKTAHTIKSHHNVGGLPEDMDFKLIEPLRSLFKDEVRVIGEKLGISGDIVWRQPFPGPGLGVRVLGEITEEKLGLLREADAIVREEIKKAGLEREIWQAFAVLPSIKSVGFTGNMRTYAHPIIIRAVASDDAMTAEWTRLPYDLLDIMSRRIINEVQGINRVVYDITSKPPGTIEWE